MTIAVYRGRKATTQQQLAHIPDSKILSFIAFINIYQFELIEIIFWPGFAGSYDLGAEGVSMQQVDESVLVDFLFFFIF